MGFLDTSARYQTQPIIAHTFQKQSSSLLLSMFPIISVVRHCYSPESHTFPLLADFFLGRFVSHIS